jgi:hypothetical protein
MAWLNYLERRFGRYAIPELTWKLIALQTAVYIFAAFRPEIYEFLLFDPARIMKGEVWRFFSFILIPPVLDIRSAFWFFFAMYFFWIMGSSLEHQWGYFRYNMFWLIGIVASLICEFFIVQGPISNWYMGTTLFLAFATLFPDYVIYLFFILPVRVKYLAYVAAISLSLVAINGDLSTRVGVVVAFSNYLLFFGPEFWQQARVRFKTEGQRKKFQEAKRERIVEGSFHECSVCKRTDVTDPHLEFRVGTDGKDYCIEHVPK